MSDRDIRIFKSPIEIRSDVRSDGSIGTIRGYAAVYNSWSEQLGYFRERISPGAFTEVLKTAPDVRLLVDHDSSKILARTSSGTLRLGEDKRGLWYEGDVADTTSGRDILESVRRSDVDSSSFAFILKGGGGMPEQEWNKDGTERTIHQIGQLLDVSAVTYAAYPATTSEASLRSLDAVQHPNLAKYRPIVAAWVAKYL